MVKTQAGDCILYVVACVFCCKKDVDMLCL